MPIQLNGEAGGKVLAVHVSGKLAKADYEHFVPEFERLIRSQWNRSSDIAKAIRGPLDESAV